MGAVRGRGEGGREGGEREHGNRSEVGYFESWFLWGAGPEQRAAGQGEVPKPGAEARCRVTNGIIGRDLQGVKSVALVA